jgi:hypothetical protein
VTAVAGSGGAIVIDSDIRIGTNTGTDTEPATLGVCPDYATVSVGVRNKNPRSPAPAVPSAVIVDSYVVRYFRTDGRGVEGVDVPFRITGYLTVSVDVSDGATTDIPIEIVRRQAKNEPPLSMIQQTTVLTMFAEVTVYGTTVAGDRVSDSGRVQVDFAEFADKLTACPGQ